MSLARGSHKKLEDVEAEFKNLDSGKENSFVYMATRAPNASDKGQSARVWIFKDGATLKMYLLDTESGVWRGPTTFS